MHARVAHQRGADVALAGQQRERARRHAGLAQRAREHERAAGRLLGRLEDRGVAGRQRRRGHAERDRDREVPGRDDRDDPARVPAHLVALAGRPAAAARPARGRSPRARSTPGSRSPRTRRRRPRATASRTRGPRARRSRAAARAATARRAGAISARCSAGAFHGRAAASAASTSSGVAARGLRDHAVRACPGSVETMSSPSRRSSPIHTGHLQRARARRARRARRPAARGPTPRRSSRIGSLANGFTEESL